MWGGAAGRESLGREGTRQMGWFQLKWLSLTSLGALEHELYARGCPVKWVKVAHSCPTLCDPMDYTVHGILQTRILEWVAFPFSRDLPKPGIEPRSPSLQADSLPAEPQGSPGMLEWVAYPFSSGSSQSRNWTGVPSITGGFFTVWATGKLRNTGVCSLSLLQWIFPI